MSSEKAFTEQLLEVPQSRLSNEKFVRLPICSDSVPATFDSYEVSWLFKI